jgi:broad-specificity NMP kinase
MILAITGTPGTGKTSVAEKLSEMTGWELVKLNELADKKGLYSGYDEKRDCKVINLPGIKKEISRVKEVGGNLIIESHYAHDISADLVVVLRANPDEIRKRGKEKGWEHTKTEENVVAEIMEECKIESMEHGRTTFELDTTGKSPEESAKGIAGIMHAEGMFLNKDVKIPDSMREKLREPHGRLFSELKPATGYMAGSDIIAVGDFVAYSLYSSGVMPKILVLDGLVRRKPYDKKIPLDYETVSAKNRPGYLMRDMWQAVKRALEMNGPAKVLVDGEEDMAVLPFVLLAKAGSSVIYGLFDKGVCVIKVDEDSKNVARNLLRKIVASQ